MVVDTNALSAILDAEPDARQQFFRTREFAIPVIVLGEYRFGIAQSRRKREYERWLEDLVSVSRVLVVSEETAVEYFKIRVQLKEAGTPIPSNDTWIAALCQQHGLSILSRDRHFDYIQGLRRFEW